MLTEALLMPMLASFALLLVTLVKKGTFPLAFASGLLLGLLCLTKATFLPFIIILPVCLMGIKPRINPLFALILGLASLLVLTPWTLRNYLLVGHLVPVHLGAGFNMKIGNAFAVDLFKTPLSYQTIWENNIETVLEVTQGVKPTLANEIAKERLFLQSALTDYRLDWTLLPRKIAVGAIMFWYIGEDWRKTIVIMLLQLPLIILTLLGLHHRGLVGWRGHLWPVVVLIFFYWAFHVPFAPPARLSVPILPLMTVIAVSIWHQSPKGHFL